jgi:two-component system, NarL family, sensor histidine kinase BarA
MANGPTRTFEELTLGNGPTLEELLDRATLDEFVSSFYELFRVHIKVYDVASGLVVGLKAELPVYEYLNQFSATRKEVSRVVADVKNARPEPGEDVEVPCCTGARYRVAGVGHDGRTIGWVVLGPFLPAEWKAVPQALLAPELSADQLTALVTKLPRVQSKTMAQIAKHLMRSLDVMLFSGHKALLASSMHLASVTESYRQVADKNKRLEEANERLLQLDRLKSNLLATVSHELRTPLTSIIGYSEMLREGIAGPVSPEQRDFIVTIHEKGSQLLELISGLLDLSKMESGTLALRRVPVELAPIVRDVLQTLAPMARMKGVRLSGECEAAFPPVLGDVTRLRQVVLNLADNALKFTPTGGEVTVRVRMTHMAPSGGEETGLVLLGARQSAAEITVTDTGVGVPDSEKDKIFEPFYQVDSGSTREAGGTGLGLSIVQRLVAGHQGTIRVEDNRPTGAKMVVVIPLKQLTMV